MALGVFLLQQFVLKEMNTAEFSKLHKRMLPSTLKMHIQHSMNLKWKVLLKEQYFSAYRSQNCQVVP